MLDPYYRTIGRYFHQRLRAASILLSSWQVGRFSPSHSNMRESISCRIFCNIFVYIQHLCLGKNIGLSYCDRWYLSYPEFNKRLNGEGEALNREKHSFRKVSYFSRRHWELFLVAHHKLPTPFFILLLILPFYQVRG